MGLRLQLLADHPELAFPLHEAWRRPYDQDSGFNLTPLGDALVLGTCDSQPPPDDPYADPTGYTVRALDAATGAPRFTLANRILQGVAHDSLYCTSPRPSTDWLERYVDGQLREKLHQARKVDTQYHISSAGVFAWPAYEARNVSLRVEHNGQPLPGKEVYTNTVSSHGHRVGIVTWKRATVLHDGQPVWERKTEEAALLVDEHGWLFLTPGRLEAWSQAELQWEAQDVPRHLWANSRWVVAPGLALDRRTGSRHALPELDSLSELTIAGDQIWCLSRWHQLLTVLSLDGKPLYELKVPLMNVSEMLLHRGALYLLTNLGELLCYRP